MRKLGLGTDGCCGSRWDKRCKKANNTARTAGAHARVASAQRVAPDKLVRELELELLIWVGYFLRVGVPLFVVELRANSRNATASL